MDTPDFNLLVTLDVLLAEGSVARAADRLQLSPSAMSRALARLRHVTGDPLLVKAGRGLVPTPRALELRERVRQLVQDVEAVLRPIDRPDLTRLSRTFSIRTSEGFVENFGPALLARIGREAPGIRLRFMQKLDKESGLLRDGVVDMETGVVGKKMGPEVRTQRLFRDRFVGVVRAGHTLAKDELTLERYAAGNHVAVSRKGMDPDPIAAAMEALGVLRNVAVIVGGFATAVAMARESDLIATVPERHTGILRSGMTTFSLPISVPAFTVSLLWHPRMDGDPVHGWLRGCIREICADDGGA